MASKKWRESNVEACRNHLRRWRKNNKERNAELGRKCYDKAKNTIEYKYRIYKRGANFRGFIFELTLESFKENWNKKCKYCNSDIKGVGFDRVDNSKGYTIKNTVNCCAMCNRMKHAFLEEDFVNQCKKIAQNI